MWPFDSRPTIMTAPGFASTSTCPPSPFTLAHVKSACITGDDMSDSTAARRSGPLFSENSRARSPIIPVEMSSFPSEASRRKALAL